MDGDKGQTQEAEAGWYHQTGTDAGAPTDKPAETHADTVEWTASEFIAHDKGFGWYAGYALVAVIIAALLYLIIRDVFSIIVVAIMAVILAVAAARKPRVMEYKLDRSGLTVGNKFYPYQAYKSFSLPETGPFVSIELAPLKRLGFPVSLYLAPDNQDRVLEILSDHLPMERHELSSLDHLMHQLRF